MSDVLIDGIKDLTRKVDWITDVLRGDGRTEVNQLEKEACENHALYLFAATTDEEWHEFVTEKHSTDLHGYIWQTCIWQKPTKSEHRRLHVFNMKVVDGRVHLINTIGSDPDGAEVEHRRVSERHGSSMMFSEEDIKRQAETLTDLQTRNYSYRDDTKITFSDEFIGALAQRMHPIIARIVIDHVKVWGSDYPHNGILTNFEINEDDVISFHEHDGVITGLALKAGDGFENMRIKPCRMWMGEFIDGHMVKYRGDEYYVVSSTVSARHSVDIAVVPVKRED